MKANIRFHVQSHSAASRLRAACFRALLVTAGLTITSLGAQSTWVTGDGSWSVDGNWFPAAVPLNDTTTQLLFEASGSTSYTTTNDIGSTTFSLNRLTLNNTGTGTITIAGAGTANSLTFGGVDPTLDITGRVIFTGLMAGSATITKTGNGTFIHDSNNTGFTGTLIIDDGTFINRSTLVATTNFNPASIVVNDGGTYQFGENTTGNPNLPNNTYITVNTGGTVNWQEGEDFGGFHLNGGTIILQAGGANCVGTTAQSWSSGTLTGNVFAIAGTASINKTTSGTVNVTGNAALNITGAGSLNILDGTFAMAGAANLGNSNVNLGDNAGTTTGTFEYQGGTASRVGNFGVNAGGGIIHITDGTTVLTLSGVFSGTGNLRKTGPGKLKLTGSLNGTGTMTAAGGILQVDAFPTAGSFAVEDGAVLSVNSGAALSSFIIPSMKFTSGATTMQFDLDSSTVAPNPLSIITNPDGLIINGTPTLKLTNLQPFANGLYTLLDYDGIGITSGFNLALPGRTSGSLIYDTVNTRIDVSISGTDTVKWTGAVNSDWDVGSAASVGGTSNWRLVTAGTATNFIQTDTITFDDSATTYMVNLTTSVLPFATVVNASANYLFTGSGKISGSTALSKAGTGTLTLATDNDYTGGTSITGGSLQLGNGSTTGSLVGPVSINGGTLAFNHSDDSTFGSSITIGGPAAIAQNGTGSVLITTPLAIGAETVALGGSGELKMSATVSGTGILNKEGTGTLTLLANNNAFTGTLNVNGGTVLLNDLGGGGDLGASSIVINNSGTFILGADGNVDFPDTTIATINNGGTFRIEQGENYGGFILNGGEFRLVASTRTGVNSTAVTTVAGSAVYDLRSGLITTDISGTGTGGALNSNGGGVLTKTTSGTVVVNGRITFQAGLELQIREGTLAMEIGNVPTNGTGLITLGNIGTAGTLQINGSGGASTPRPFFLEIGGGTIHIPAADTSLTINSTMTGGGPLAKTGNGALVLNGVNDYAGGTTVSGGSLEVDNFTGSGTGSGPVIVNGTLMGDGGIFTNPGSDVRLNGIFQPGYTGAFLGTDFSISTGVGGRTIFGALSVSRFDLWSSLGADQSTNPGAADLLLLAGDLDITAGATLKLMNPMGVTFQDGDVFRLFDWTGLGVRTGAWIIDSSDLNLAGLFVDTSNLYTTGTIAITSVPEPGAGMLMILGLGALGLRRSRRRG